MNTVASPLAERPPVSPAEIAAWAEPVAAALRDGGIAALYVPAADATALIVGAEAARLAGVALGVYDFSEGVCQCSPIAADSVIASLRSRTDEDVVAALFRVAARDGATATLSLTVGSPG